MVSPGVSESSITAGVGSKEREGDLLPAMVIPFDVLEGVIDTAERRGIEHATVVLRRQWYGDGIGGRGCSSNKCQGFGKYDNCPDEMVLVEVYV